ncbi:MAG: DUF4298 domain-containing protein [Clostridia bacterium]|nr:DUF4298 domain-containing protein [Clostridia bacterium]
MKKEDLTAVSEKEALYNECLSAVKALSAALDDFEGAPEKLKALAAYYESPEWRRHFELDERGAFPKDMPRGVLSEDGVYDLLDDARELNKRLRALAGKMRK